MAVSTHKSIDTEHVVLQMSVRRSGDIDTKIGKYERT